MQYKDLHFDGDMRDIKVSFDKIARVLGFKAQISVEEGIREMAEFLRSGLLNDAGIVLKNAGSGD
ncbi:MAG: hypothetical protein ABSF88_12560 [Candidatus Aminicenantales bacterium]